MVKIADSIYWVGVNDHVLDLFEAMWPIPEGISYNSYLITDDKVALIDAVKENFLKEYLEKIERYTDPRDIDYLIVNHMEPDHSGSIPLIRRLNPNIEIVGTKQTKKLLNDFFGITEGVRFVDEGDSLALGERTLTFFKTPYIHWPETMMTYDATDHILFSGDAFGTFGTIEGQIFDDRIDVKYYEDEGVRYFSNVVGLYSKPVQAAIKKLESVKIDTVASTHGPVWRTHPQTIIELYDKLSKMEGEKGVTIIYGSMYGYTRKMAEAIAEGVHAAGCKNLTTLDASRVHLSSLLSEAWRREGIILGSPTYEGEVFPPLTEFTNIVKKKQLKNRVAGVFGSFGWTGGALPQLEALIESLDWDMVKPVVEFNGVPRENQLENGKQLGKTIAEKVLE
ncbi:MAG: FprA family A-type flavoprotein [Candidatus Korarchaeota archaeon]|nr:FprA family A-type flavoprotein [Candidatus Korarchaeota archaeon]NIU83949.1 MBL fold metallo-hydrolase [Candidatus Thorarchaeota archaeon]NIW14077.1 MBL fold metallo-hydrolase [Candidatus Thorarchaeota archaeon]NIW52187.1 MBL fold metallo-hydrolase [Candidatus Korarchaeota archaeon]